MAAPEQTTPTHIGLPEKNAHFRVLKENTSGYVAPVFAGKDQQMEQGNYQTSIEGLVLTW